MTTYVRVARTADVPPCRMIRAEVNGDPILVANLDNRFFAVSDTCSHEDASLVTGALQGEFVRCPLHGSRFSVKTGEVQEEPAEENLTVYPVRVEDGDILIGSP